MRMPIRWLLASASVLTRGCVTERNLNLPTRESEDMLAARHRLRVAWLVILLALVGCAGSLPPPPPKLALHWDPPSTTTSPGNLAIAIVDAQLTRDKLGSYRNATYLTSYSRSVATDIQRVLVAKGLKVTGPFDDFESMTFPEKKGSDLALIPRINLEIDENYSVNTE